MGGVVKNTTAQQFTILSIVVVFLVQKGPLGCSLCGGGGQAFFSQIRRFQYNLVKIRLKADKSLAKLR